ncbi:MAG: bluetail domain-containing putative surface protein, partial [Cyanobacteriota bacterium]|nr:bluetail domain-containing putative surface protein [Cyanobacteriota bacterium]
FGTAGNDTLDGAAGNDDTANYSAFTTSVTLSALGVLNKGTALGTDTLIGIERIIGSASSLTDTIDLSGTTAPATGTVTNLTTGSVAINGSAGVLVVNGTPLSFAISQFENVLGSNFADSITGNALANTLNGGLGNDTLNGGDGIDTASYADAPGPVTVSLTSGTASGAAGNDTLISIENILGGGFADSLTGNALANNLNGGGGNDFISAEAGSDFITGNGGKDTMLGGADNNPDTFIFNSLSDSLLALFDVIGDYTSFDILDRPGALATTLNSSNGTAAGLSAPQISAILNNFSFTANSSRAFTAIGFSGTFVAFNDDVAGFSEFTDSIIHLPSFNIGPTNTISIA